MVRENDPISFHFIPDIDGSQAKERKIDRQCFMNSDSARHASTPSIAQPGCAMAGLESIELGHSFSQARGHVLGLE